MQLKEASVLVVEDEPVLLEIMAEWFQRMAGKVFRANGGAQALEIATAYKIDLILTDVRMPGIDGISLLNKVKATGPHAPAVIFITGFADFSTRDAYDLGAEGLLEKPLDRGELIDMVRRSLLDAEERWRTPSVLSAYPVLRRTFASLAAALQRHRIAFGRGGFCIEAGQFAAHGPVNIDLNFRGERYVLSGQGIVRWLAHRDDEVGIELTYVAEPSRARVIELSQAAVCFIPRTTGRMYQALAG
jgi:CheY-like chemotaxis protein